MPDDVTDSGIVVLGLPRSGTTLLRRILNAHPNIACGGETFLLRATAQFLDSDTIVDGIDYGVLGGLQSAGFSRETVLGRLRSFAVSFLQEYAASNGKRRWAVKSAVDSFYISQIEEIYSGHVKFVCVVRHGLDAVCSLEELSIANEIYIKELHHYIRRHARPLLAYAYAWRDVTTDLLDFTQRNPGSAMLLRYEDLVSNPAETVTTMFDFLGESTDEALIERALQSDVTEGLGDWKTARRATIDGSSVGRSAALRDDVVSQIGSIINSTMTAAGYDPVPVNTLPGNDAAMRRRDLLLRYYSAQLENESE